MNLIEILIISVGLSLDVYAVVVCQGAVLLKIERMKLLKMSLIFCIWQVAAVMLGHFVTCFPYLAVAAENMRSIWYLISVIIFMALGVYMLYKAWKNEVILERLSDIKYKQVCAAACFTSIDALFAGMGFGFLNTRLIAVALNILIVTAFFVVLGLYTGYRLGYEQKTKAYGVGGVLLLISAFNVIFKYMV
ncbi:MAG: manganese efflux pump MntP family protein [Coprococcus sp.]